MSDLIEPVLSVPVKGILYFVSAFFGGRVEFPYSYYVPIAWIIICFGIFLVGKLFLSVGFTKSTAMVIYSRAEILLALIMVIVNSVKNTMEIAFLIDENREIVIRTFGSESFRTARTGLIIGAFVLVLGFALTAWYFISCSIYAALSYQQNFLPYPFTSFFAEIIRLLIYVICIIVGLLFSGYAHLFFVFLTVVAILVYPQSRKMLDYFYYQDILTFRYLITDSIKKSEHTGQHYIPKALRKKYPDQMFMVAFLINKDRVKDLEVPLYEKVYLLQQEDKISVFHKSKRKYREFVIDKQKEMFFVEGHENYAIFTLDGPKEEITHLFKRPKRDLTFYISKANEVPFRNAVRELNIIDYDALLKEMNEKKEKRYSNGSHQTV